MQYIEQWGSLGVFIASVIPFVDAIALMSSIGVTFPFNLIFGIPIYLEVATLLA